MNYTLHQLQIFLKVCQTRSITKASEELFLTQPAVSIQLRNFQDQFETPLTELIGRKLYITDFGLEIAQAAEKIIEQVYAINYRTLAHHGKLTGKLKLSVVSTGKYVMPYLLQEFMQQHEGIELQMDVTNRSRVIQSLENNETDFALMSVLPDQLSTSHFQLMKNKLFLVGNTPFVKKSKRSEAEFLRSLTYIYRESGSATRQVMEKYLIRHEIKALKKLELTSNEAVKQAVMAGLGHSIMPLIGIKNELKNKSLYIMPLKGFPIQTQWYLVWPKNKKFSPAAQAYLDHLKQEKDQLLEKHFAWTKHYG